MSLLFLSTFALVADLRFLSIGRSKMWDQDANGYARGDGVASCVLKTLSRAIADGDHIECIIRETGLNQDGGQYIINHIVMWCDRFNVD